MKYNCVALAVLFLCSSLVKADTADLGIMIQQLRSQDQLEVCEEYLMAIDKHAKANNAIDSLAKAHFILGYKYRQAAKYKTAYRHYRKAKSYFTKTDNLEQVEKVLDNMAMLYVCLYDFQRAEHYYKEALQVNIKLGNKMEQAVSIKDIAFTYRERDEYATALIKYKEAYDMMKSIGQDKRASNYLVDIGICNYNLKQYNAANDYYWEALRLDSSSLVKKAKVYNNSAKAFFRNGEKKKAYHHINRAIAIKRQFKDVRYLVTSLNNLGMFLFEDGNYTAAISPLVEAYQINNLSEIKGDRGKELQLSLAYLDSIALRTHNPELIASLKITDKHKQLAFNTVKQLLSMEVEYNLAVSESITREIKYEQEQAYLIKIYYVVGGCVFLVIAGLMIWIRRSKKKIDELSVDIRAMLEKIKTVRANFFNVLNKD